MCRVGLGRPGFLLVLPSRDVWGLRIPHGLFRRYELIRVVQLVVRHAQQYTLLLMLLTAFQFLIHEYARTHLFYLDGKARLGTHQNHNL